MAMDSKSRLTKFHKSAYEFISEALKLDEGCDGIEKRMSALKLYKKGVNELQKGLALPIAKDNSDGHIKVERLRDKMAKNLKMANDRVTVLEKQLECENKKPTTSRMCANNTAGFPTRSRTTAVVPPRTNFRSLSPPPRLDAHSKVPTISKMLTTTSADTTNKSKEAIKKIKGLDAKLGNIILDQVLETRSNITFEDVSGLNEAKQALNEAVILPTLKPELFTGLRSPVQGILLFGPPGNGKTMLARAVAGESNCVFFNISASALTSKWVGEAEKLVKALFLLARDLQPVIVFIDEIDSILCERSEKETEVSRRLKTEFLLQFDGVSSNSTDKILIIGATNRPQDLDDAVLRRFPKRIYVGLPDSVTRRELLEKLISKHHNSLSRFDLTSIVRRTDNYCGSDLMHLAKEAAMGPLREIPADHLVHLRPEELRPISLRDFEQALTKVKPSCKFDHLRTLLKFKDDYGSSS